MNEWLTVTEVAELLGITRQAVYRLIDRGTLAASWKWGRRLIRENAVQALLESAEYEARSRRVKNA